MLETVVSADGTAIAFERFGAGPALVAVGGAFSTRRSMIPLAQLLASHFTVYVYDRRGRGDSGPSTGATVQEQIGDLLAVIGATGAVADVFGHSSGGVLALWAAAGSDLVGRLAVYEPPLLITDGPDASAAPFAAEIRGLLADGRAEEGTVAWFTRTNGGHFDDTMRQLPWWPALVAVAPTLPDESALTGDGSIPAAFSAITVPTRVFFGGASPAWAARAAAEVAATVRDGSAEVIEGQGHIVDFGVLAAHLADFLTSTAARRGDNGFTGEEQGAERRSASHEFDG
jgi:pimeloyl-ACP methyl ester carboxylesterase